MAELTDIAGVNSEKSGKYYSIFLNAMASVAKGFDAKIIKNVGDGLVCYFPKTSDRKDDSANTSKYYSLNYSLGSKIQIETCRRKT